MQHQTVNGNRFQNHAKPTHSIDLSTLDWFRYWHHCWFVPVTWLVVLLLYHRLRSVAFQRYTAEPKRIDHGVSGTHQMKCVRTSTGFHYGCRQHQVHRHLENDQLKDTGHQAYLGAWERRCVLHLVIDNLKGCPSRWKAKSREGNWGGWQWPWPPLKMATEVKHP